jgi:Protein involved in formate dehydrogenase formation
MPEPHPWAAHRRRAVALRDRHAFAAEPLGVYLALLDVWEDGWERARAERPHPSKLAAWAAERVLPEVARATGVAGPEPLAAATRQLVVAGGCEESLASWLAGDDLQPVERYLARASLWPALTALGAGAGEACAEDPSPRDDRHCPRCGGLPQFSFRTGTEDRLVTGRRHLACARCGYGWSYSASSCPCCGEATGAARTMYAERREGPVVGRDGDGPEGDDGPTFPHLRVDACATCQRYLIDVDLGRDAGAVPEVDELAALPLDLYATDRGLCKITPNLMGF